ncbi:MAG: PD-(D/E)XK nuclease family protein [Candidatus Norongarragalinales archaeon]
MLDSKPFANEFSWSVSADKTFSECKRKYYYDRYGMWNGWLKDAPEKARELYFLKKLSNKDIWTGASVHWAVKNVLDSVSRGKAFSFMEAEKLLDQKMKRDYNDSKENLARRDPKAHARFFEHEYSLDFGVSEALDLIATAKKCLRNFFESETYAWLKTVKKNDWLTIDEQTPTSFNFEGTKVFVKLDAAIRTGDRIAIFDWKTSRKEDVDYTAQLACYLLYANRVWNSQPNKIDVFEVNLMQNYSRKHAGLSAKIDWIENYMRNSISGMKSMLKDAEKNEAQEEKYPRVNEERKCKRCFFVRVCKPPVFPQGEIALQ